jgi:hypothetical protein
MGSYQPIWQFSATYSPLPTLDALRPHLEIQEINTGRQYALTPSGIVTDDMEGLHALPNEHGKISLLSGTEFFPAVYRGQTETHPACVASLGRKHHIEDQLLELCRNVAFEDAIGDHPFVRVCEQTEFQGAPLFVDRQGLAQHYGLATDMLDVTSNFDIACFFATCYWDGRSYRPVKSSRVPGVLYRLLMPFELDTFRSVGWQPFHRPEQQRAHAVAMKAGQDFAKFPRVQMAKFRQHPEISTRIWKSFDEGRALFPTDAAANLAEQAKQLMQFTRSQLDRAWVKLDAWHNGLACMADGRLAIEQKLGAAVVENAVLNWDGLNVEHDESRLQDRLREVLSIARCRRVVNHVVIP